MLRNDRQSSEGGVMITAKNIFNCKEIHVTDKIGLEFLGLTITLSQQMSFTLLVIYRSPLSNANFFEKLEILLKQHQFYKRGDNIGCPKC